MLFEQVHDSWQKSREIYKLWHRQDFLNALIKDVTGLTTIGAAGDHAIATRYNTTSTTAQQINQSVGPGVGGGTGPGGGSGSPTQTSTARAFNSANQTIPNNVATALVFDSTQFDTGAFHSNTINNSRLTISQTGFYMLTSSIEWAANATGVRSLSFRVNGLVGDVLASEVAPAFAANNTTESVTTIAQLNAGDYVEAIVLQSSGGNLSVLHTAGFLPCFAIARIK